MTNNLPVFGKLISENLSLTTRQVCNTLELLDSGATVPFISRYRKERTGSLDEVQIAAIQEQYDKLAAHVRAHANIPLLYNILTTDRL